MTTSKGANPTLTTQVKDDAAARLEKVLTEYLFTWFFRGPRTTISDGTSVIDIEAFLENANLSNMFAVSVAFQPYDGNNTQHPI